MLIEMDFSMLPKELNNNPIKIKEFLILLKTQDKILIKKYLQKLRKYNYNKQYNKDHYYDENYKKYRESKYNKIKDKVINAVLNIA